jgi:hypothetical protein
MYPLLMPGSFLQVDDTKTQILKEGWRSEYERPIYFVDSPGVPLLVVQSYRD